MTIEALRPDDLDRLRPLWLALHAHHQAVAPRLAPFIADDTSWRERRRQYVEAMAGGGFGFLARADGADIGYLLCARRPMAWNATFDLPPTLWELVTLFVAAAHRGRGIGAALLAAMDAEIARAPMRTLLIGVIPDNRTAVALYRRRGLRPAWLTLTRFRRPTSAPPAAVAVAVETAGPDEAAELGALWLALHHHHQAVSPDLGPFVPDDRSWPVVRELFEKSAKDGLLLVARDGGRAVGLASAAVYDIADTPSYGDSWLTGDKLGETKFLVVAAGQRGRGIGAALMDAVDRAFARRGVADQFIGAIAPNAGAIRFYESRGFRPAWLELLKT